MSAALHVLGFALAGFASQSLFLLFSGRPLQPAFPRPFAEHDLGRLVTLFCMVEGSVGTVIEVAGALMAPAPILIGIILADLVTAGLLVRALWHARQPQNREQPLWVGSAKARFDAGANSAGRGIVRMGSEVTVHGSARDVGTCAALGAARVIDCTVEDGGGRGHPFPFSARVGTGATAARPSDKEHMRGCLPHS